MDVMKDIYISDLKTNQEFISYFIVKSVAVKVGSNKKAYLDLLLADGTDICKKMGYCR